MAKNQKIFYKKELHPSENGLQIFTRKWICIHETECFCFCIPEYDQGFYKVLKLKGETDLACARRRKILKRISKQNSRFAFDSEEKALEHLRFLKKKQLSHMRRDIKFLELFLATPDENMSGDLIPDSKDLVEEYFIFD